MLRADMNTIVAFLKDHVKPMESVLTEQGMLRGYLMCDHAGLQGAHMVGYNYADLQRIGTIMGIDVRRLASLADGHMDYFDDQSVPVLIHTVLLVSDTGAFTAADQTYTDAGKCGVFAPGGGETILIRGSLLNNGIFTTVSAGANTVVVTAGFVDEADAPLTIFM